MRRPLRVKRSRALAAWPFALLVGCATVGSSGEGDQGLPSTGVGPFRKLAAGEVPGVAPFVLDDAAARFREPAVLPLSAGGIALYLTASAPDGEGGTHDVIVRTRADDGRAFYGATLDTGHAPRFILGADAAWEGHDVSGASPLVFREPEAGADTVLLFYAGAEGIGLARSSDGLDFHKDPGPILGAADHAADSGSIGAWETSAPRAPSVALLPDGRLRMFYAAGRCLGEAESAGDPAVWRRRDADPSTPAMDPVLCPAAPAAPGSLAPGEPGPFDTDRVDDPLLLPRVTPAGRLQIRVLYTGYGAPVGDGTDRPSAVGFAARYGDSGPLVRAAAPVYSIGRHEAGPALFDRRDGTAILYVTQDHDASGAGGKSAGTYPAIGGAFAPADHKLPQPAPFAVGP